MSNLIDKIFLSKIVAESIVYAIWVSLLSVFMIVLLVADVLFNQLVDRRITRLGLLTWMTPWHIALAVGIGILFTLAIYFLYTALQRGEASRVIPLTGGSMPVLIYLMSFSYDPLDQSKLASFIFLVSGTVLISMMPKNERTDLPGSKRLALAASFSFALFFVLTQILFRQQGFLNGIVWPRLGSALALLFLFSFRSVREKMRQSLQHLSFRLRSTWLIAQGLGAIGFLGQQYVISLPGVRVALVSALQSVQYVFILVFATLLSFLKPKLLSEQVSPRVILQKVLALISIAIGLYYVSL